MLPVDGWSYEEGRLFNCTRCGFRWRVHELPGPFIDRDLYVCPDCLVPVEEEEPHRQLELLGHREETRNYDPTIAEIPF
jgi:hypothetical protein